MGMSPAPTIANLYVGIYKRNHVIPLVGVEYLMFFKRFIDDGSAVWLQDKDPTPMQTTGTTLRPVSMQWALAGHSNPHRRNSLSWI